jgi:hypothetical protein
MTRTAPVSAADVWPRRACATGTSGSQAATQRQISPCKLLEVFFMMCPGRRYRADIASGADCLDNNRQDEL